MKKQLTIPAEIDIINITPPKKRAGMTTKKLLKKVKKVVDKALKGWYLIKAVAETDKHRNSRESS